MMANGELHKLTVYKLETGKIDPISLPKYKLVKAAVVTIGKASYPYRLFFLPNAAKPATWYQAFAHLNLGLDSKAIPKTMLAGFVLITKIGSAVFGVTGGVGHIHLKTSTKIAPRFGIELAQRILSLPELRGLSQKDTSGNVVALDRIFRGIYNPVGDLNNLKRVLKLVRGTLGKKNPYHLTIGRSIQATDALTVNGTKTFRDLFEFLKEVNKLATSAAKQINIPQLAHIDKKTNAPLLGALESELVQALCNYDPASTINLFLDNEEIGYLPDRVTQYELIFDRKKYQAADVAGVFQHARAILSQLKTTAARLAAFHKMRLRVHFDDGVAETRSFAYFVCGDITYNNDVYFINNELWYRTSDEFLAKLDAELDNIQCLDASAIGLAQWDPSFVGKDAETKFNNANKGFHIVHPRLVKVQQEKGGIEYCDFFASAGNAVHLVYVKKACGAELRALFAQGFVPAKLYAESDEFRKALHDAKFTTSAPVPVTLQKALKALGGRLRREFKIIYAIFDNSPSHKVPSNATTTSQVLKGTLTTFAKVDLVERARAIQEMSYDVAVTRIRPYPKAKGAK